MIKHKHLFIYLFLTFISSVGYGQINCNHQNFMDHLYQADPNYEIIFENNNDIIQQSTNSRNGIVDLDTPHKIPVVFHVMHLGETSPSNIPDELMLEAIDQLNSDFENMAGTNTNISFCLAQRDPYGLETTGINRFDASDILNYESIGIAPGQNEVEVKAASLWPNTDYVNIWIVHDIAGSNVGYGTFPGTSPFIDGIVIRYDVIGDGFHSKIITHEMGHFFQLYHTFQTDNGGFGCSENDVCNTTDPLEVCCRTTGDRCCDTESHIETYGCPEGQNNLCTDVTFGDVLNNHMSYTDNSCRDRFTYDQIVRIRTALIELRTPLVTSLKCEKVCEPVQSSFTMSSESLFFSFTADQESDNYEWTVNGVSSGSTQTIYVESFTNLSSVICLETTNDDCSTRSCVQLFSTDFDFNCSPNPNCEIVTNGDLQDNPGESFHYNFSTPYIPEEVCGWERNLSSPYFCTDNINGEFIGGFQDEWIVNLLGMDINDGEEFEISFEYYVNLQTQGGAAPSELFVGVTNIPFIGSPINEKIVKIINPTFGSVPVFQPNICCPINSVNFVPYSATITYQEEWGKYLVFGGDNSITDQLDYYHWNIKNISVSRCVSPCDEGIDFEVVQDGCNYELNVLNPSDEPNYIWSIPFEPGQIYTYETEGSSVDAYFAQEGEYNVCLTAECSDQESTTICKKITADQNCVSCVDFIVVAQGLQCNENSPLIATAEITIPNDVKVCPGVTDYDSGNPNLKILSVLVDDSEITHNTLFVTMEVLDPNEMGVGSIKLCHENGTMPCFLFSPPYENSECETCMPNLITSHSSCDESNKNDNFLYYGSYQVTVPAGYMPCSDTYVTESGYSHEISNNGNTYNFDYEIITSDNSPSEATGVICFENGQGEKLCFQLELLLPECTNEYEPCYDIGKLVDTCDEVNEEGNATFSITESFEVGSFFDGLQPCYLGVVSSSLPFGEVLYERVDFINIQDKNYLVLNVNIEIPCIAFESGMNFYNLEMQFCDENGNEICVTFELELYCEDCRDRDGKRSIRKDVFVNLFPVPAQDHINYSITNFDPQKSYQLIVKNTDGTILRDYEIKDEEGKIDLSSLNSGLYFATILEGGQLATTKKITVVK